MPRTRTRVGTLGAAGLAVAMTVAACADGPLPVGTVHLALTAQNVAFDRTELVAPAGHGFVIDFTQADPDLIHNVEIRTLGGDAVFSGETIEAGQAEYIVPPLPAGRYVFICVVHPIPTMTGTLTARS